MADIQQGEVVASTRDLQVETVAEWFVEGQDVPAGRREEHYRAATALACELPDEAFAGDIWEALHERQQAREAASDETRRKLEALAARAVEAMTADWDASASATRTAQVAAAVSGNRHVAQRVAAR